MALGTSSRNSGTSGPLAPFVLLVHVFTAYSHCVISGLTSLTRGSDQEWQVEHVRELSMGQDCVAICDRFEVPDHIAETLLYIHDHYDGVGLVKSFPCELRLDACSTGQGECRNA